MAATSIYLDTNAIIAIVESSSSEAAGIQNFWQHLSGKENKLFHTSEISLAELLVVPYRHDDHSLVEFYLRLFLDGDALVVHEVTRPIIDIAAVIRSRRRMKLPDAIHLATASVARCSHFITFDTGITDLSPDRHPFLEDVTLWPVKVINPDGDSLRELSEALT